MQAKRQPPEEGPEATRKMRKLEKQVRPFLHDGFWILTTLFSLFITPLLFHTPLLHIPQSLIRNLPLTTALMTDAMSRSNIKIPHATIFRHLIPSMSLMFIAANRLTSLK